MYINLERTLLINRKLLILMQGVNKDGQADCYGN